MEKVTKKNSIIFNQLWINKIIEERHMELLPYRKPDNQSIGEYIEEQYLKKYSDSNDNPIKISKNNSILFEQEWRIVFNENNITLPIVSANTKYSLAELMEQKYQEKEEIEKRKILRIEKCIQLNN